MIKQFFGRFNKRAGASILTSFPFGSGFGYSGADSIPTIRRCISIYSQFLNILDLETEDDRPHYFIDLLKAGPHAAYSRSAFMEALAWETLINGQFICRLGFDKQTGKIDRIYPFRSNTARAYTVKGDYADPEQIEKSGYYYRSNYSGRVFWPDEALHVKDCIGFQGDILNSQPRSYFFRTLFNQAAAVQNVSLGLANSGGRGAVLIEGLPMDDADNAKDIRDRFQKTLQSGLSETTSQVMGMPQGYKAHRLLADQSHSLMQWLAERTDLEVAKIFDVPFEILQVGKIGAQSLKEVHRAFIRYSVRSFLAKVADAFSLAVNDGTVFVFRVGKLRFSDAREAAQYYSALITDGVLSPAEVKAELES